MANSVQKKIKFSKGQVSPNLIERTDLELYNSSAQVLKNVSSTVYGGIKTRQGSMYVDNLIFNSLNEDSKDVLGTATSTMGDATKVQNKLDFFETGAVADQRELFVLDYNEVKTGFFSLYIKGIHFNYKEPSAKITSITGDGVPNTWRGAAGVAITDGGLGVGKGVFEMNSNTSFYNSSSEPTFNYTYNEFGSLSGLSVASRGVFRISDYTLYFRRTSSPLVVDLEFYTSVDKVNWEYQGRTAVSESAVDVGQVISDFRYVKAVLVSNEPINTTLSMQYAILKEGEQVESDGKLISFVYNNEDKYLLLLGDGVIYIYQNDIVVDTISATGLKSSYLKDIKYSYKDDVIIFTHEDMRPKELRRLFDKTWQWRNFEYEDVPVHAFDGETEEGKTVGITPSMTEGALKITAASAIFDESWVGNLIDGNGGRFRITEFISSTVVNGSTIIPFYTEDKITDWKYISGYEPVWSETRGYPRTCLFAQQRLWFGGSKSLGSTIWSSRLNDYNSFKNAGNYDNDAIDVTMLTNNKILNLLENRGIHVFTSGDEWIANEGTLTPDKFSIIRNSQNGCFGIPPVVIGGVVCFVEKTGKSLLSYVYDYNQSGYGTDNLSIFSSLIKRPISVTTEINSSADEGDFIYMVLEDGKMLSACIDVQQSIFSITSFETLGTIKDVESLDGVVYMIVSREGGLYLEKLEPVKTDCTTKIGVLNGRVDGADIYNNTMVYVYDDNYSERVFISDGVGIISENRTGEFYIGYPFDFEIESNPIAINNKTVTCKSRIAKATVHCVDTQFVTFNGQTKRGANVFDFYGCTPYYKDTRFIIKGEFNPVNIMSVTLNINYEG